MIISTFFNVMLILISPLNRLYGIFDFSQNLFGNIADSRTENIGYLHIRKCRHISENIFINVIGIKSAASECHILDTFQKSLTKIRFYPVFIKFCKDIVLSRFGYHGIFIICKKAVNGIFAKVRYRFFNGYGQITCKGKNNIILVFFLQIPHIRLRNVFETVTLRNIKNIFHFRIVTAIVNQTDTLFACTDSSAEPVRPYIKRCNGCGIWELCGYHQLIRIAVFVGV
ncbi:MAG: hypothetical protein IIT39_12630 [Clostridia bacterium]|nr:hypothetical protein [Clostridia bacterium]